MNASTASKSVFSISSSKQSYRGNQGQISPNYLKTEKFHDFSLIFVTTKLKIQFLLFEVVDHIFSDKCANFHEATEVEKILPQGLK